MYTLGTVFLEVVTSFDGVQHAARAETRKAMAGLNQEIDRDLAKGRDQLNRTAAKSAEQYGSAFEKSLRKRMSKMQDTLKTVDARQFVGGQIPKWRDALKDLKALDLSKALNQDKALLGLKQIRTELNGVFDEAATGRREMRGATLINLGALRQEIGAAERELKKFRDKDVQTKSEDDSRARAQKAIKAEQDAWQKLGQSQMAARRMMDADFNRRAQERLSAIEKEQSAERAGVNQIIAARRLMDAEYDRRAQEQQKARRDEYDQLFRGVTEGARGLKRAKIGVDIDQDELVRQTAEARATVEAMLARAVELGVDVDSLSTARQAREAVRAAEEAVAGQVVRIDAEVQKAQAEAQALALRSRLAAILDEVKINPEMSTAAKASLLAEVQQMKAALRSISGSVNVTRDILALERLERQLAQTGRQALKTRGLLATLDASGAANSVRVFSGALFALLAFGPLLAPVLAVIAAGIVGVGFAALGALSSVGVLVLALSGIGGALKAMNDLEKAKRTAPPGTAKSGKTDRQAIVEARSLADAQKALGKAREGAAESILQSAERVAKAEDGVRRAQEASVDAQLALNDARVAAAEALERSAENIARAEASLSKAQAGALSAQQAINEARAQAVRDLEDMNAQLASARLQEQEAAFSVEEAAVHLNVVLEDDQATAREKAKAKLAYDQALQRQQDQIRSTKRLEVDVAKANAAGVEGSDRVVSAKDNIVTANERVSEAEKSLADAQKTASKDQLAQLKNIAEAEKRVADANKGVIEAQGDVADAQRDAARSRVSALESIADAEENLRRTREDAAMATAEAAAGTGALATATTAYEEAMRKLSPAGRAFAEYLFSLKPLLKELTTAAQEGFLPGLQASMQMIIGTYGPGMVAFVGDMAEMMGLLAIRTAEMFTNPFWRQFFDDMAARSPVFLELLGEITGNLLTMTAGIMQAFAPLGEQVLTDLVGITDAMAEWGVALKDSAGFRSFMEYLNANSGPVFTLLGNILQLFAKILVALAPYTELLLGVMIKFTDWLIAMDDDTFRRLVLTFGGIALAIQILAGALSMILGPLGVIAGAMRVFGTVVQWVWRIALAPLAGVLAGISAPVWIVIGVIAALVAAFVLLWKNNETFRDKVKEIWASLVVAWNTSFGWIVDTALPALGQGFIDTYNYVLKPVIDMVVLLAKILWEAFKLAWDFIYLYFLEPLIRWIGFLWTAVISPTFNLIVAIIRDVLGPVFASLWTNIISPTFNFIMGIFAVLWSVVSTIFNAIYQIIKFVVAPVFEWFYNSVIKPVMDWIGAKVSAVYNDTIKPIFDALSTYITDTVGPAFTAAVNGLGAIWETLLDFLRAPIRLGIEYVINKGLIAAFNWLAGKVPGMTKLDEVAIPDVLQPGGKAPRGRTNGGQFAAGGRAVLPGRAVGFDNHHFVSDTGISLDLAGGEGILVPELTDVIGETRLRVANRAARGGDVEGGLQALGGFARGGVVKGKKSDDDGVSLGDILRGVVSSSTGIVGMVVGQDKIAEALKDPAASIRTLVESTIEKTGITGFLGQAVAGVATKPIDDMANWIKSKVGLADEASRGTRTAGGSFGGPADAMGYQAQIAAVKAAFPTARITSSYRPGAITAVGTKSYHGMGRAIDIAPNMDIARWLSASYPNSRELIHTPLGTAQIRNGAYNPVFAPVTKAQHYNHIHWAMMNGGIFGGRNAFGGGGTVPLYDNGGDLAPGLSFIANKTGKPESVITDRFKDEIRNAVNARKGSGADAPPYVFTGDLGYHPEEIAAAIEAERRLHEAVHSLGEVGVMVS